MIGDQLQGGIYFRTDDLAPPCYRALLLHVSDGASGASVAAALQKLLAMLHDLRDGRVRELAEQEERGTARTIALYDSLRAMVGFGRRLFDDCHHKPKLVVVPRPEHLAYLVRGGAAFPSLTWTGEDDGSRRGEADIIVQLTAASEAAVNCAAIELWKLIVDDHLPLSIVDTFDGFARSDGRGWLEFHDGLSNVEPSQRPQALVADSPSWMQGGSYMAVLRLSIDIAAWRALTKAQQEFLVGRDKMHGGRLVGVTRSPSGEILPVSAAPPDDPDDAAQLAEFLEPLPAGDPLIEASHLRRANRNAVSPFASAGQRLFRQGYEFLDGIGPEGPRLGLNFVSFQSDLNVLQHVLHLSGWLGDVNFGGIPNNSDAPALDFVRLIAGGLYAVPPTSAAFPGAAIFRTK